MNQLRLLAKLEGLRNRNSTNHQFINKDLYRMLYDEDIYIIAYNAIKSNHGAETKGADGTSLNGFCMEWVHETISTLKDESYKPLPNKTQLIPKKNGKMRKLGFPNGKDKLLQEAIRIILECIYEPTFSDYSHGFRPNRSTQTAMAQIENWHGTSWFIEGDISACFDEIDHRILESIRASELQMSGLFVSLTKCSAPDTSTCNMNFTEQIPERRKAPPVVQFLLTSISINSTVL